MKITSELVNRYLKNQCSAEEATYLENYIRYVDPNLETLLPQEDWNAIDGDLDYANQEDIRKNIFASIEKNRIRIHRTRIFINLSKVAAAFILFLGVYGILNQFTKTPVSVHSETATISINSTESSNLYYINSGNDIMTLTASDGSIITLYPKSEIKYPEDFSNLKDRILYLKGKAKFNVTKDINKPFRVHSTGVTTTALGTIFIVDELRSTQTQVKLLEGKIEVKAQAANEQRNLVRTIMPNEEITLDHHDLTIVEEVKVHKSGIDRGGYFLQNAAVIQFKNIALEDVINVLIQNYDIDLHYDKRKISNKFYSGHFNNTKQVYKEIIQEINYLHHVEISYTFPNK